MTHPWLKKNPLMSMWLSTANRVAGSFRGHATAQVQRMVKAAIDAAIAPAAPKARVRRRR